MTPSPDIIKDFSRLQSDVARLTSANILFAQANCNLRDELEAWQNAFEQWGVEPETARAAIEKLILTNVVNGSENQSGRGSAFGA